MRSALFLPDVISRQCIFCFYIIVGKDSSSISVCVGDYNKGTKHHYCMLRETNKDLICKRI